jgi:rhodanese-related sulfurtransferase
MAQFGTAPVLKTGVARLPGSNPGDGVFFIPIMKQITRNELKKLIDSKEDYILIDLREKDELKHGIIPTSKNISVQEIESALKLDEEKFAKKYKFNLNKKSRIIFYCRSGGRASYACQVAEKLGYKPEFYAGILDWAEIDKNIKKY